MPFRKGSGREASRSFEHACGARRTGSVVWMDRTTPRLRVSAAWHCAPLQRHLPGRRDVSLCEILALEQQLGPIGPRTSVGEAIADVQGGWAARQLSVRRRSCPAASPLLTRQSLRAGAGAQNPAFIARFLSQRPGKVVAVPDQGRTGVADRLGIPHLAAGDLWKPASRYRMATSFGATGGREGFRITPAWVTSTRAPG